MDIVDRTTQMLLNLGHPVMAISMRGSGLSDKPKDLKSHDKLVMVEDIRAAAQHAKDNCIQSGGGEPTLLLAGHDWGSAICWECAKQGRTTKRQRSCRACIISNCTKGMFSGKFGFETTMGISMRDILQHVLATRKSILGM